MFKRCLMPILLTLCVAVPAFAQARTKLVVGMGSPILDASVAANVGVPLAMKYWDEQGLDVSIQPGNATMHLQALLGGTEDIFYGGPATAFQAMEKGAKLRLVYLFVGKNIYFPVVPQTSAIRNVADLKGKTIGVASYASQLTVIMKGLVSDVGLDPKRDISIVEIGVGPQAIAALRTGQVDAWGTFDAQIAGAEQRGLKLRELQSPYLDKLSLAALYIVREDYYQKNQDALEKFFRGVAEGTLFTMTNPEGAVHALWSSVPSSKSATLSDADAMSAAMAILRARMPAITPDTGTLFGQMTTQQVDDYQDFLAKSGMVTAKVDSAAVLAPEIWKKANEFDSGRVIAQAKAYK
jgi:NitT/TauT family transport system substrate-binding protein